MKDEDQVIVFAGIAGLMMAGLIVMTVLYVTKKKPECKLDINCEIKNGQLAEEMKKVEQRLLDCENRSQESDQRLLDNMKAVIAAIVAAVYTAAGMALVFIMTFHMSWIHETLCGAEMKEIKELETNLAMEQDLKTQCMNEKVVLQSRINCYQETWLCQDLCK
jgi:hypothetical protein